VRLPLTRDVWLELSQRLLALLPGVPRAGDPNHQASPGIPRGEAIEVAQFVPTRAVRDRLREMVRSAEESERRVIASMLARLDTAPVTDEPHALMAGPAAGPEPDNLPELRQRAVALTVQYEERSPFETQGWCYPREWEDWQTLQYLPSERTAGLVTALYTHLVQLVPNDAGPWAGVGGGNEIVRLIEKLHDPFVPDIPSLFENYLMLQEREPIPVPQPSSEGGGEGWRPLSWQLAWVVSRAGLRRILADLVPRLSSDAERERLAALRLIEEATRYVPQAHVPLFGGGSSPDDVEPIVELIDEETAGVPGPLGAATSGAEGERQINMWVEDGTRTRSEPLALGRPATLGLNVALPVAASLTAGPEAAVPDRDVPRGGLPTVWMVMSSDLELLEGSGIDQVSTTPTASGRAWTARFSLHVPHRGPSETRWLGIVPRSAGSGRLQITITVADQIYRQLSVSVAVEGLQAVAGATAIDLDVLHTPAAHLQVGPRHEWQTPPGTLNISVLSGGNALVQGRSRDQSLGEFISWTGAPARLDGPIINVRQAAEDFRGQWEDYLDNIDPADLDLRLRQRHADREHDYDWRAFQDRADAAHRAAWDTVAAAPELRRLAYEGHVLYQTLCPSNSQLRTWIDGLQPGHRLNVFWQQPPADPWVPHVPWGLMYLPRPPAPGDPVDPTGFLGLRFRIEYRAHPVQGGSVALGSPGSVHRAFCLYWGTGQADETAREAQRQQGEWSALGNAMVLPVRGTGELLKRQILRFLNDPSPRPTAVVYLYCQCGLSGQGRDYALLFGSSAADEIRRDELDIVPFADRPLIFANACLTASASPYAVNALEEAFFARAVRGYLGTETRVPIQLAGRFATIFFRYFNREIDPDPIAAGEAVAQARIFLWTNYRNIGGLFYTYVQQYELSMMDEADVPR
jgi:hypothetical protein